MERKKRVVPGEVCAVCSERSNHCTKPVSYTHLDVYKRQYLYHSIHGRICACKEEICGTTVTFHMDRMRNGITKTGYFDPITS